MPDACFHVYCTAHARPDPVRVVLERPQLLAPSAPAGTGRKEDTVEIEDTVVFAHGIGNLIVANAVENRFCELGASSFWLEINVRGASHS